MTGPQPKIPDTEAHRAWLRPAALLALFATVFAIVHLGGFGDRFSLEGMREELEALGYWAPAALLALFVVRPLLLVPITPFWVAAGALFGFPAGAVLAAAGTSLGAAVGFGIARGLGRDFVERRVGTRLARWAPLEGGEGLRTILALQLTPVMPHDLINSLAGVSRISYRTFFLASLAGTIPIITIYAWIGNALLNVDSPTFWVAMGLLSALTIAMLMWNRRRIRRGGRGKGQ